MSFSGPTGPYDSPQSRAHGHLNWGGHPNGAKQGPEKKTTGQCHCEPILADREGKATVLGFL